GGKRGEDLRVQEQTGGDHVAVDGPASTAINRTGYVWPAHHPVVRGVEEEEPVEAERPHWRELRRRRPVVAPIAGGVEEGPRCRLRRWAGSSLAKHRCLDHEQALITAEKVGRLADDRGFIGAELRGLQRDYVPALSGFVECVCVG